MLSYNEALALNIKIKASGTSIGQCYQGQDKA